jgi:hypothetical protein
MPTAWKGGMALSLALAVLVGCGAPRSGRCRADDTGTADFSVGIAPDNARADGAARSLSARRL